MLLFLINSPALIGPQNLVLSIALPCPTAPLSGGFYLLAWALTGHRGFQAFSWGSLSTIRSVDLSSFLGLEFLRPLLAWIAVCDKWVCVLETSAVFPHIFFFKSSYLHFGKQLVRNLKTYFFFFKLGNCSRQISCEFKTYLVFKVSSSIVRATQRIPVSNKTKQNKQTNKQNR